MKIQSYSDIITNSSSELFVFDKEETLSEVICMISKIYPDWRKEYLEPVYVKDEAFKKRRKYAEEIQFKTYGYITREEDYFYKRKFDRKSRHHKKGAFYQRFKDYYSVPWFYNKPFRHLGRKDFNKNKSLAKLIADQYGINPEDFYSNWDIYNPFFDFEADGKYEIARMYTDLSEIGINAILKDNTENVLLWSIDENPDWDYQEKLMEIASRYHLG